MEIIILVGKIHCRKKYSVPLKIAVGTGIIMAAQSVVPCGVLISQKLQLATDVFIGSVFGRKQLGANFSLPAVDSKHNFEKKKIKK